MSAVDAVEIPDRNGAAARIGREDSSWRMMCIGERGAGEERGVGIQFVNTFACGLADDGPKCFRQEVNQITGDHRDLAKLFGGQIAGQSVNMYAKPCGIERRKTLAEQGGDDAGQYIAQPPVAMPGLPVWLRLKRRPSVTTVSWPLRTTMVSFLRKADEVFRQAIPLHLAASSAAPSLRNSPCRAGADNRANSPGCGVRPRYRAFASASFRSASAKAFGVDDHWLHDFAIQSLDKIGCAARAAETRA